MMQGAVICSNSKLLQLKSCAWITPPLQNNIQAFQAALTSQNISTPLTDVQVVLSSKLNLLKHFQQLNISLKSSLTSQKQTKNRRKRLLKQTRRQPKRLF
ncbi:Hypothetical_protein [Hexamita inflata]|uniref:Hypothetical_protein n=1 Tax=Hexamita inflata TaxID=28002 RepID=A0AA86Q083_9EUKA|nr:Hypothetical protein HINF_LOCUS31762 [Hexamita inflata]